MNYNLIKLLVSFSLCLFINNCSSPKGSQAQDTHTGESNKKYNKVTSNINQNTLLEKELKNVSSTSTSNLQSITELQAKIKYLEKELQQKGDKGTLFNNPYAMFNQQIIMDNGTTYYGSVVYQDDQVVTIETLIGKLNLQRERINRVVSHNISDEEQAAFPEVEFEENITTIEDGQRLYKSPAKIILLGNINTSLDEQGNTVLSGQVKNSGGKRADFVKINMTLFRDWSKTLPPKLFTVFVNGSSQYFDEDSTKVSSSSIEPKAIANFSLVVPKSFGSLMSWSYDIDFEQY